MPRGGHLLVHHTHIARLHPDGGRRGRRSRGGRRSRIGRHRLRWRHRRCPFVYVHQNNRASAPLVQRASLVRPAERVPWRVPKARARRQAQRAPQGLRRRRRQGPMPEFPRPLHRRSGVRRRPVAEDQGVKGQRYPHYRRTSRRGSGTKRALSSMIATPSSSSVTVSDGRIPRAAFRFHAVGGTPIDKKTRVGSSSDRLSRRDCRETKS